jgi:hypothetical protein
MFLPALRGMDDRTVVVHDDEPHDAGEPAAAAAAR